MNGCDRPIILLYLLFPQSQLRDKGNVKMAFYHRKILGKKILAEDMMTNIPAIVKIFFFKGG